MDDICGPMKTELQCGALATALVVAIGLVDYATTPQLSLGVLYFAPVAFAAWKINRPTALFFAAAATLTWALGDNIAEISYSSPWFALWNAGARAFSFVLIALLVSALCAQKERLAVTNQRLQDAIKQSELLSARLAELQNDLQVICSWTNRIRSEGRWMRFEEFMQRNFSLSFTHGISEEAAAQIKGDVARTPRETSVAAGDDAYGPGG
jgi:hypothetical protein